MKRFAIIISMFYFCFTDFAIAQQRKLTLPAITNHQQSSTFELINLTGDSSVLGYMKIGPEINDREAIVTPADKKQWLQNVTAANAEKAMADTRQSVLYILHDISAGRISYGNYVRIKAAVYAGDEKNYALAGQADTLLTDKAKDITAISDLIATGIAVSVQGITSGSEQFGELFSREQAVETEKQRYAFIRRNFNPAGIYMNYEDYRAGKPSFVQFYVQREGESSSLVVHSFTKTDSTLRPVKPWAVAINNELYYYDSNKLYPVEVVGNNLFFSKFIDPETRRNNASFWRMTVGDQISGKESNVFDNVNTLELTDYRGSKMTGEAIKINSDTGAAEW